MQNGFYNFRLYGMYVKLTIERFNFLKTNINEKTNFTLLNSEEPSKPSDNFCLDDAASTATTSNAIEDEETEQDVEGSNEEAVIIDNLTEDNESLKQPSSTCSSQSHGASNNVDIFENVFNYNDDDDDNEKLLTLADEEILFSENQSENLNYLDDFNHYDPNQYYDENSDYFQTVSSNISLSLRNSLLKLRHSRRHLAALIEQNSQKLTNNKRGASNGSTTPVSSTTSSLTTTSNMSLYKQHLLNSQNGGWSRKPCVYMLNEGKCMRGDCRFVHDLKSITCKYWLEGECLKGENCEFLHECLPEPAVVVNNKLSSYSSSYGSSNGGFFGGKKAKQVAEVKKKDFKLDSEEFPALGGPATDK